MPSWSEILNEIKNISGAFDVIRRKYIEKLSNLTQRNVIAYYSAWLQKAELQRRGFIAGGFEINDADKNAFMSVIHGLNRAKGLDLLLHTPGGDMAATESLIDYLRSMFGTDIRAIIPQIAMSGGTMIALACKEIIMGKHSNLGPTDPQIFGLPAHGIIEEFNQASNEIKADPTKVPLWQVIFSKYTPTLIGEADKAIRWANEMVKEWLLTGMFTGEADAQPKADKIIAELADHALTKSHARHISLEDAKALGLKVIALEDSQDFQEAVLSVHHAYILTLDGTATMKIIENHEGKAYIQNVNPALFPK